MFFLYKAEFRGLIARKLKKERRTSSLNSSLILFPNRHTPHEEAPRGGAGREGRRGKISKDGHVLIADQVVEIGEVEHQVLGHVPGRVFPDEVFQYVDGRVHVATMQGEDC